MSTDFTQTELELMLDLVQKTIAAERKALQRYYKSPNRSYELEDPKADKYLHRIVRFRHIEEKLTAKKQNLAQSTPGDSRQ